MKYSAGSGEVTGFFRLTLKHKGGYLQDQHQSEIALGGLHLNRMKYGMPLKYPMHQMHALVSSYDFGHRVYSSVI